MVSRKTQLKRINSTVIASEGEATQLD